MPRIKILLSVFLLSISIQKIYAEPTVFESGPQQTIMIELYTLKVVAVVLRLKNISINLKNIRNCGSVISQSLFMSITGITWAGKIPMHVAKMTIVSATMPVCYRSEQFIRQLFLLTDIRGGSEVVLNWTELKQIRLVILESSLKIIT